LSKTNARNGLQDGVVSHVGLRRIILETPEVEAEIGPTLTRTLLAHAEQNLYGRLTFEVRDPFLSSPLGSNFDFRGEMSPRGVNSPGGEVIPWGDRRGEHSP
jgi:hypothetical protein